MSNSLAASFQGHDYQGRIFLKYAAQLRVPDSNIVQVGFEYDFIRAFDDVVVFYQNPIPDEAFDKVHVDYFQVKYQVRQGDVMTLDSLVDPAFINATAVSFLQRLKEGVAEADRTGQRARFTILSPREIGDDLRVLLNNAAGAIDLDQLFDGRTRTRYARIRKAWREHLGISSDQELRAVLAPLRIRRSGTLEEEREAADIRFAEAGLCRWDTRERASRYDDFPRKLVQSRLKIFDREAIERLLHQEHLIAGPPQLRGQLPKRIGIRSYMQHAEQMEAETEAMHCLCDCFEGREIRDPSLWESEVRPQLDNFLREAVAGTSAADLWIAAHPTIAFAAGWCLDMKAIVDVAPRQGKEVWRHDPTARKFESLWIDSPVESIGSGPDFALCLSVTRNVRQDVESYIKSQIPSVGQVLHLVLPDGEQQGSVKSGTHAFQLAEAAVTLLGKLLPRGANRATVHMFISAPNALVFFLGRMAHSLGRIVMYEHDFNRKNEHSYSPTLTFG